MWCWEMGVSKHSYWWLLTFHESDYIDNISLPEDHLFLCKYYIISMLCIAKRWRWCWWQTYVQNLRQKWLLRTIRVMGLILRHFWQRIYHNFTKTNYNSGKIFGFRKSDFHGKTITLALSDSVGVRPEISLHCEISTLISYKL